MINRFKIYNVLFLFDENYENVLLLKRKPKQKTKTLNGLLTGPGGKLEFTEMSDLKSGLFRELEEETHISRNDISSLSCPIATFHEVGNFPDFSCVIYWYCAVLTKQPKDLWCLEGELKWYKCSEIGNYIVDKMTDSKYALPWILKEKAYNSNRTKTALIDLKRKGMFVIEEGFYNPFENEE